MVVVRSCVLSTAIGCTAVQRKRWSEISKAENQIKKAAAKGDTEDHLALRTFAVNTDIAWKPEFVPHILKVQHLVHPYKNVLTFASSPFGGGNTPTGVPNTCFHVQLVLMKSVANSNGAVRVGRPDHPSTPNASPLVLKIFLQSSPILPSLTSALYCEITLGR